MYCLRGPAANRTSLPNDIHILGDIRKNETKRETNNLSWENSILGTEK